MKKIKLFLVVFFAMIVHVNVLASEILKVEFTRECDNTVFAASHIDDDTTACCTQTQSSGSPNSPSYVSVTVTKCYGGKTRNDAYVAACENALNAAKNVVKALAETTVTIYPTGN